MSLGYLICFQGAGEEQMVDLNILKFIHRFLREQGEVALFVGEIRSNNEYLTEGKM